MPSSAPRPRKIRASAAGLKEIEKHHGGDPALCDKLDAEGAKREGDAAKVCAACEAVSASSSTPPTRCTRNWSKQLKIAPLEPPAPQ